MRGTTNPPRYGLSATSEPLPILSPAHVAKAAELRKAGRMGMIWVEQGIYSLSPADAHHHYNAREGISYRDLVRVIESTQLELDFAPQIKARVQAQAVERKGPEKEYGRDTRYGRSDKSTNG